MKLTNRHIKASTACVTAMLVVAVAVVGYTAMRNGARKDDAYAMLAEGKRMYSRQDITQGFNKLNRALAAFEELDDSKGRFEATVYLSMIYFHIGQKKESYKLLKSVDFIDVKAHRAASSQYYYRMMAFFSATIDNNWDLAKSYTRQSIEFSKRQYPEDTASVYMDLSNMAEIYIKGGRYEEAAALIDRLERSRPARNRLYLSQVYYCKGMVLQKEGRQDSAYSCYSRALDIAREYKVPDNIQNVLQRMIDIDADRNDTGMYMRHKNELSLFKGKEMDNELKYKIALIKSRHMADIRQQKEEKAHIVNIMTATLILFIIVLSGVMAVMIRKNIITRGRVDKLISDNIADELERKRMESELNKLKLERTHRDE